MTHTIALRAAGILIKNGKVLLQAPKDSEEYAFIGGHVEFGEQSADTLCREWKEELGADITVGKLQWIEENFWIWNGEEQHTVCLTYTIVLDNESQIPLDGSFASKEQDSNVWFHWIPLGEVKNLTVYPTDAANLLAQLNGGIQHIIYREKEQNT
jgi:ADP-ribose pyrophosphatase